MVVHRAPRIEGVLGIGVRWKRSSLPLVWGCAGALKLTRTPRRISHAVSAEIPCQLPGLPHGWPLSALMRSGRP
jgi:hypothetical protein